MANDITGKPILFAVIAAVVILIGTVVTMFIPMFTEGMHPKLENLKPYTALQLAGKDIYQREGCNNCHTQTVRPLKTEVMRYGEYSKAGEFAYDQPFLWGSKRTGPDLARVGGKYSNEWHVTHLKNPRAIVPQSIMPGYPFLAETELNAETIADHLRTNRTIGVPYSDDQIANAAADLKAQADPDNAGTDALSKRYPNAVVRNFDGKGGNPTEMDALVAYLQMLGTLVDFKLYNEKANLR